MDREYLLYRIHFEERMYANRNVHDNCNLQVHY